MARKIVTKTETRLRLENEELRSRLTEAEEALTAIRNGEVDAIIVTGPDSEKIFSLASAETPYRIIVEEMNEGAVSLSADGTILYCNPRFAELVSIPIEQIVGSNFVRFVAESEKPKFDLLMQTGIKGRSSGEIMYSIHESNLRYFHLSFNALPLNMLGTVCIMVSDITELKQKEQELNRSHETLEKRITERTAALAKTIEELAASRLVVLNMMEDMVEAKNDLETTNRKLIAEITERKHAKEALQHSEEQFRNLFNDAPVGLYRTTPDGKILLANRAIYEMLGFSNYEELSARNLEESGFEPTYRREQFIEQIEKNGEVKGLEAKWICCNGEVIIVRESAKVIRDANGEPLYYDGTVEDITERRRAEELMRESEERYRTIFTQLPSIVMIHKDNKIVFLNQNGIEVIGYSWEEIKDHSIFDFIDDEGKARVSKNLQRRISGEQVEDYEVGVLTKNNIIKTLLTRAIPIYYENGQALLVVLTDITMRKRTEEALKEALVKAEAGNRLKSSFIHNISHEVRTPLNGILGFSQLITQPDLPDEEKEQFYTLIKASSNRLINTITNYMDISLIASGNMEVQQKPFELHQIFHTLRAQFQSMCAVKHLDLNMKIPNENESFTLHSDVELFSKVLSHLLDNAVKFTTKGEITFGYSMKSGLLEFFVKDTGIGISKEVQNRIFESFAQEELSHTRGYEGSGLGLSIAKGLVSLLGGEIRVESEKDAGSTFFFTIPFEEKVKEVTRSKEKESKVKIQERPVLLIAEDEESNLFYLETLLRKASITIFSAVNGKEAVDQCRKHPEISLVLMDIKMPVMDGFEATREIKSFRKDIPVIAITAFAMMGDEKKALEAGCDDYLTKPVSKDVLLMKLKRYGIL